MMINITTYHEALIFFDTGKNGNANDINNAVDVAFELGNVIKLDIEDAFGGNSAASPYIRVRSEQREKVVTFSKEFISYLKKSRKLRYIQ